MKNNNQIKEYIKSRKGNYVGLYKDRWGKDRIYFKNKQ